MLTLTPLTRARRPDHVLTVNDVGRLLHPHPERRPTVDHVVRPARSDDITEGKGLVFAARVEGACVLGYVLSSGEAAGVAGALPDGTCLSV